MRVAELLTVVAEAEHHENVMLHTFPFGLFALVGFGVLALVAVSYRNVAHRHSDKWVEAGDEVETTHGH